ncbi:hypothetical protein FGO68_gene12536 [Halteria grandinella]|uniref:Uncharacterized protein n=1 Tax=Halteria grandinella TaxID=5974 RepID=A0A8J8SY89_HALGN|nr:hypothetical protein FGO68_gene12536 [Halteria grandinella]
MEQQVQSHQHLAKMDIFLMSITLLQSQSLPQNLLNSNFKITLSAIASIMEYSQLKELDLTLRAILHSHTKCTYLKTTSLNFWQVQWGQLYHFHSISKMCRYKTTSFPISSLNKEVMLLWQLHKLRGHHSF